MNMTKKMEREKSEVEDIKASMAPSSFRKQKML